MFHPSASSSDILCCSLHLSVFCGLSASSRTGVGRLWPTRWLWPATCVCRTCKQRMVFIFLSIEVKLKKTKTKKRLSAFWWERLPSVGSGPRQPGVFSLGPIVGVVSHPFQDAIKRLMTQNLPSWLLLSRSGDDVLKEVVELRAWKWSLGIYFPPVGF